MNKKDMIETLQREIEIPDVVQQKANQAFDKIQMDKSKHDDDPKVIPYRAKRSKKRFVVIAAVITLMAASISVAAAYLNWSKSLSEGLRATEEQKLMLEENNMTTFVGQSHTDQGITVTAVQSITDQYYTHIAFKVEGYEFDKGEEPFFESLKVTVDGTEDFSYSGRFYDGLISGDDGRAVNADGTPLELDENGDFTKYYVMDDGSIEYQITLANSEERGYFINKSIHVEINNLGTVFKTEYTNKINGTWTFDWDLQGSESMRESKLNTSLGDTKATVKRAELSPISLFVEYQFPRQEITEIGLDENEEETEFTSYAEPPQLSGVKLKDGTLYPFIYGGPGSMGYATEDTDLYTVTFAIDRIIDPEQVESLLFIKSPLQEGEPMTEDNFYIVPIN